MQYIIPTITFLLGLWLSTYWQTPDLGRFGIGLATVGLLSGYWCFLADPKNQPQKRGKG